MMILMEVIMTRKNIYLLLLSFLYVGCATISKEDCQRYNWEELGESDALSGRQKSYVGQYAGACSEFNISVNYEAYDNGHNRGLKSFCTRRNGLNRSLKCHSLSNMCRDQGHEEVYSLQKVGARGCILDSQINIVKIKLERLESKKWSEKLFSDEYFQITDEINILESELRIALKEKEIFEADLPKL